MGRILAHAGTAVPAHGAAPDSLGGESTIVEPPSPTREMSSATASTHRPPSPTASAAGSSSTRSSTGSSHSRGSKRSFSMANVSALQFCFGGYGVPKAPTGAGATAAGLATSASARLKRARADDANDANDADDPLRDRRGGRVVAGESPILASLSLARIPRFNGPLI